jgi:hypothetical protein
VQTDVAEAFGETILKSLRQGRARTAAVSAEWPDYFTRRIRGAAADHRANAATRKRRQPAS